MIHEGVEYREVPGWTGYFISSDGVLLSTKIGKIYKKKAQYTSDGYIKYSIEIINSITGKAYAPAHRLVLMAWDRLPKDGEETRHINNIKTDNRIDNLVWGTTKQNKQDSIRAGLHAFGERNGSAKLTPDAIVIIRKMYQRHSKDTNSKILSELFGVSDRQILDIVNHKMWKHI